MRTLASLLVLVALTAASCGDDADEAATTTTTSSTASTTSTSTPSTTSTTEPVLPTLEQSCRSTDGFSISYPADWAAVSDCGQFGPAPVEEPEPDTDERTGVVSAFVDDVPFNEVSQAADVEASRAITTVDALQAVRVESEESGEGPYPPDTTSVTWMVDLSIGADDGTGTLFLNAVDIIDDVDFERAVTTMDLMARSLEITVGDPPEDEHVVARYESGGAPFTVAAAPAATQPSTCLRLLDADGISCVEPVDSDDGVSLTGLAGPAGPLTVGITGSDVFAIELTSADRTITFLPVRYPARDSLAFALPVDVADLESVTLRSVDGRGLAELSPDAARRPADG